jgi:hypothetical protein
MYVFYRKQEGGEGGPNHSAGPLSEARDKGDVDAVFEGG